MSDSFIDLRFGHQGEAVHDTFWPSFTDIMMVVVLIFIMVSLALVVKNWDLVAELRTTIQAEHQAQQSIHNATATNDSLSSQLSDAQHQLSESHMQLLRMREQHQILSLDLKKQKQQLSETQNEAKRSAQEKQRIAAERDALRAEISAIKQQLTEVREQSESGVRETQKLAEQLQTRSEALTVLQQSSELSSGELVQLQGSYDSLKVKYNKLIKPARTAKGKYVVEVRYEKRGKYYHIRYKHGEAESYTVATRKGLHQALDGLKVAHPGSLYIKIIIPSDSGLSYNEAWKFTSKILSKYDYYQED